VQDLIEDLDQREGDARRERSMREWQCDTVEQCFTASDLTFKVVIARACTRFAAPLTGTGLVGNSHY
jgi:hypothetical protein